MERAGSGAVRPDGTRRAGPGDPVVERRWRRAGVEPQTPAVPSRRPSSLRPPHEPAAVAVRRAALPLQLLLPRRGLASRGAGHRGRPPRPRGVGASPTTTASTAWSASPRRPGRSACRRCSAPRSRSSRPSTARRIALDEADTLAQISHRAGARPPRARPARRRTCWCSPTGPTGYARLARALSLGHLAGEKGAPQFTLADVADGRRRPRLGAHRLPQGRRAGGAASRDGPAAAAPRAAAAGRAFGRDRVLVELWDHGDPLDSARNDALAEIAARVGRGLRGHQQRALRHARRSAGWPPRIAAVRARRSLDELDPWLPGGHRRPPAPRGRAGAPVPPLPRRGRAGRRDRPGRGVRPLPGRARTCRRSRALRTRRRVMTRCSTCASSSRRAAAGATASDRAAHEDLSLRARAWTTIDHELDVIEHARLRRATSWSCGTSSSSADASDIFCQGRGSAANRRSATRSASPTPTPCRSGCCSSGSCRPSATARRTSTSTSRATGARR